ncbi:MAG: GAF domain-containing protein [Planctomycetaceae bacterium]|nr:GAF domain-containing protein [Planctomycetaceae bacterium]
MDNHLDPRFDAALERPSLASWRSIVLKLTLFVGVLVALTAGTLITVGFYYTSLMLRDQIDNRLSAMADDRRALLLAGLHHLEERVRILTSRYRLIDVLDRQAGGLTPRERLQGNSERTLDDVRRDTDGLLAFWIEDQAGDMIVSSGPRHLLDLFSADARTPRVASRDPALIGFPRHTGETYAALFRTVARSRTHGVVGQLMLVIDVGPILSEPSDPRRLGDTGEVLVGVRDHDMTRYLIPPRLNPREIEFPASRTPAMNRAVAGEHGFMRTHDRLGHEVLAAFRPVGYEDWGLVAKMDVAEAYAPINRLRRLLLAIGGLILTLGLAASYLIARQNTVPIRKLAATADAIARGQLDARIDVNSGDEIGVLGLAFTRMTEQLARSHTDLEQRIIERTRDLEAMRDLLDAFFRISTSRLDPQNIERTFDSVLRFCHQLGYDLAMVSLVDREAGVIRGVRGAGTMSEVVAVTVRPLQGDDILAIVVREGHSVVIGDSTTDTRCDQAAVALAQIRGQIILPLIGDEVLGTLQVATPEILLPERVDLRPLESLASHTARALNGLKQVEEIRRLNRSQEQQAVELVKSAAALREQTWILQLVLDCMREGVVVADREARLLVFNPAAERILGRSSSFAATERWAPLYKVYRPDRVTPYATEDLPLFRAIRGESLDHAELYIAHPSLQDGSWMLVNARPLRDDQGEIQGGMVVFHDVTHLKNDERRLAVQHATTRVLSEVDSLTEAIPLILEIVGQRLDWDIGSFWRLEQGQLRCVTLWHGSGTAFPNFEEMTRKITFALGSGLPGRVWSARKGAWIAELSHDSNSSRWSAAATDGLRSGFAIPILVRGECLSVLEFFSRVPRSSDQELLEMMTSLGSQIGQFIDRHQMHARVVQSEKLASLGMLSAGVAHEINNPLAYIANNLAVLERDIRSLLTLLATYEKANDLLASSRPELLGEIDRLNEECDFPYIKGSLDKILRSTRQGVMRVAEIVNNLRGFARLDRAAIDQIDIHEALSSALEMIRGRLHHLHISVEEEKSELPLITASPVQINQVFLNLLVNAMQAIEATHQEYGRIIIRTQRNAKDVIIEIVDNGCGIPAEVLPQIFDPFFTTKTVGDGTGLGLSITHGIVQDHGGRMEVESTPGRGTCFRVILPVLLSCPLR